MATDTKSKSTPVLLLGKTLLVGRPVSEMLKPEYEVIHFIQSEEHARTRIPALLMGKGASLDITGDEIGSLDYGAVPQAIILGGGFSGEVADELRKHVSAELRANGSDTGAPWLTRGPDGEARMGPPGPDYAKNAVKSVKSVLKKLEEEGALGKDGEYHW